MKYTVQTRCRRIPPWNRTGSLNACDRVTSGPSSASERALMIAAAMEAVDAEFTADATPLTESRLATPK
jgi:hypothetical protein